MHKRRILAADQCPDRDKHTECPESYLAWHEWARQKARTHRSTKCPTCGLYAIWIPRAGRTTQRDST